MREKRERERKRESKTTASFLCSSHAKQPSSPPCDTNMTRALVLDALLVLSQVLLDTEEPLVNLHSTCRSLRYTPHLACHIGAAAVAVLDKHRGWWVQRNVRVSFDLLATGSLHPRGQVLDPDEAWYHLNGYLPEVVSQVLWWTEADTCFWVFTRLLTAETEILCEARFPGGFAALLLFHLASLGEDDQEEGEEEDPAEDDNPESDEEVASHSTHSVFGSDAPSLDGDEVDAWREVVTRHYEPVGAEEVD